MPTRPQIIAIQQGRRHCRLNDDQYRTLLRNVAGVESSKELDNRGVEDVLAVLEDSGFDSHPAGPTYWRDKVRLRGSSCGERMARKIHALAGDPAQRYDLAAMCRRMSGGRTAVVEELLPREAWQLIEGFKAIVAREELHERTAQGSGTGSEAKDQPERKPASATEGRFSYDVAVAVTDDEVPF